jgi:fumarate reductase subunit D
MGKSGIILIFTLLLLPLIYFLCSDDNFIDKLKLNRNRLRALILFLISSIALWGGTLYVGFGDKEEKMRKEHYLGLLFYIVVGVLTWLRLIYTI